MVGLRPEYMTRYPHAFSGGQRQRIGIARALALNPKLIVCDEPVSALDVSVQAQVLNLLEDLQREFDLTYLFVAHDLSVVEHISDRVAVMYVGKLVEMAATDELFYQPQAPLHRGADVRRPQARPARRGREPIMLPGEVANPANPPSGCYFHPRCRYAQEVCSQERPHLARRGERALGGLSLCRAIGAGRAGGADGRRSRRAERPWFCSCLNIGLIDGDTRIPGCPSWMSGGGYDAGKAEGFKRIDERRLEPRQIGSLCTGCGSSRRS